MAEGMYTYSGIPFGIGETLREKVICEVERINKGQGEDLVDNVLGWVRRVRIRALHDFAVCNAIICGVQSCVGKYLT